MKAEEQSQHWQQESLPIFTRIATWREEHPHATMAQIEQAVDEQMHQLRAQVLQEVAQSGLEEKPPALHSPAQGRCPQCDVPLQARGEHERRLQTQGGQWITLRRSYLACPRCGYGFFPPG